MSLKANSTDNDFMTLMCERAYQSKVAEVRRECWRHHRYPTAEEELDLSCLYFQTQDGLDTVYDILTSEQPEKVRELLEAVRLGSQYSKPLLSILRELVVETARVEVEKSLTAPFGVDEIPSEETV